MIKLTQNKAKQNIQINRLAINKNNFTFLIQYSFEIWK